MYQWIIFVHVVSALIFFMAHGVAMGVALRARRERQLERLRALLELSNASRRVSGIALLALLASGIAGGFMLNWWHMGWIWVSLVLLVVVSVAMSLGMTPYFNALRKAVGSPYQEGRKLHPAAAPASAAEIDALLDSSHMGMMAVIGIGILVVIVYLMMFKPF